MPKRLSRYARIVILDTVGVLLIIASPLTGAIPGPGGIPVFLAGLALLSIHHEWAQRLLHYIRTEGTKIVKSLFSQHPVIKWLYDLLSVSLIFIASWLVIKHTSALVEALGIVLAVAGIGLFMGNRKRINNFYNWLKRTLGS